MMRLHTCPIGLRICRWIVLGLLACACLAPPSARSAQLGRDWDLLTNNGPSGRNSAAVFGHRIFCVESGWDDNASQCYYNTRIGSSSDGITWGWADAPCGIDKGFNWGDLKLVTFKGYLWALHGTAENFPNYEDKPARGTAVSTQTLQLWRSSDGVAWTTVSQAATPANREDFGLAVFNNKLWLVGGWDGGQCLDDVWCSDDGVAWNRVAAGDAVPWKVRAGMACTAFNGRLWVIGGWYCEAHYYREPYQYIEYSDAWSSADGVHWREEAPIPYGASALSAAVLDGKLWVSGGETYHEAEFEIDEYDEEAYTVHATTTDAIIFTPDGIDWTTAAPSPAGPLQGHSCVVKDGRMFLIGGTAWGSKTDYDQADAITTVWASPDGVHDAAAASSLVYLLPRTAGQQAVLTVKNTGSVPWTAAGGTVLKVTSDPNRVCNVTSGTIPLAAGTVVNPGQAYSFVIPVDLSQLWVAATLQLKMYQGQISFFGDTFDLALNFIHEQPLAWHKVEMPNKGWDTWNVFTLTAFNDRLRLKNFSSEDGRQWVMQSGLKSSPWADNSPWNEHFTVFNNKLWVLRGNGIWKSSDGMSWSHAVDKVPWPQSYTSPDPELEGRFTPSVSSCCVWNGRLYVMINYDVNDDVHYDNYNCLWSTADGSDWDKIAELTDLHGYGALTAWGGKLWLLGGVDVGGDYNYDGMWYEYPIPAGTILVSANGRQWSVAGSLPWATPLSHVLAYRNRLWALACKEKPYENNHVWVSDDALTWKPANDLPYGFYDNLEDAVVFDDQIWALTYERHAWDEPPPPGGPLSLWVGGDAAQSLTVTTTTMDFGRREILSGPSAPQAVTLASTGLGDLSFTGKGVEIIGSNPGEFMLSAPANLTPLAIAPLASGATRPLSVAYNPTRLGPASATLRLTTDDPRHPTVDVRLEGQGVSPLPLVAPNVLLYLLGLANDPAGLDRNGDGRIDIGDLLHERTGAIQVTAPARGAVLTLGAKFALRWQAGGGIKQVKLTLARDHAALRTLVKSTANTGSYDWTVPADLLPGDNYTVIVADAGNGAAEGESPAFCAVAPLDGALTVVYPNGGESLTRKTKVPLHWLNTAPAGVTKNIKIELYKGDQSCDTIQSSFAVSSGDLYVWEVPGDLAAGDNYRLVVSDAGHAPRRDASDGRFSIR